MDLNSYNQEHTFSEMFWIEYGKVSERDRIMNGINAIEDMSHATRTPLFQNTLFSLVREVIIDSKADTFPPQRFRDIANAE